MSNYGVSIQDLSGDPTVSAAIILAKILTHVRLLVRRRSFIRRKIELVLHALP